MSVIDQLLDLQEQDSVIKSLEKQVHDIPKRRKLEQEKLDDYRRELEQARETLERAQKVEAQSQLDSDQQASQIAKYEKQRQEVKTNNEYAALGRQIESCRRVKAEYDERAEKARAHIEAVQENIALFEARLKEESAQVEAYVDELRAQLVEAQEKLIRVFHGVYGPTLANVWNGQKYALQQLGVIASPLTLAQEMDGLTPEVKARIEACVREYRAELD